MDNPSNPFDEMKTGLQHRKYPTETRRIKVKFKIHDLKFDVLYCASAVILLANLALAATNQTRQLTPGEKARVTGSILSRDGDLIRVRDKKSGELVVVNITDNTKIERRKHRIVFPRHADMDVTAMLPGLTIAVEGSGNSKGQLDADKIAFTPDTFAVDVAEERQLLANKAAAQNAQFTANQGVAAAKLAQTSASQAQVLADQADVDAQAAGELGIADAAAVTMINQRVSDLDDYKVESEVDVWFDRDSATLKDAAKPALAQLAAVAKSLNGYLIEISGYASNTLGKDTDQKLSEERAAAVAGYFREAQNIPTRRLLVPTGYGRTHQLASNNDREGRELNRRVDVRVLVNTGLRQDQ
jgi:outer membrane protein OmpA-like peptidoglycan-associated protein